jgi:predicted DNA-binding transcriptional regulator AlpA
MVMEPLLVTVKTLAEMAGISPRQVWRDVKLGACPPPVREKTKQAHWSLPQVEPWLAKRQGRTVNKPRSVVVWWARPLPELVRVEQLAHMISWSERSIWRAVACGEFPAPLAKPLRPRLWRTADVVAWAEAGESEAQQQHEQHDPSTDEAQRSSAT